MAHIRELIRDKNFSLLWLAQVISNFGDRLNQMALIGLIYVRTPGSTIELAKLLSFTIIPVFIIGPIAGSYVDRWDRKTTMIVSDLLRGILVLFIPIVATHSKSMPPIYILVFLIFSITRFFLTSKLSIIPDIVHKEKLLLANSLSSTTMMIATIVGFGFGGLIVGKFGAMAGFYIDAASYFISGVMLFFITVNFRGNVKEMLKEQKLKTVIKKTVLEDIKEGLVYLKNHADIRMVANTMFLLMAGVGSIYIVIIVFIQEKLRSSTEHLGLLVVLLGLGLFLGSVVYGRFGSRISKKKVINFCLSVTGLLVVIFAVSLRLAPSFLTAGIQAFILGLFGAPIIVSSNTLLYEVMLDEMRGRIFSSLEIIMHLGFILFMFFTSVLAEHVRREWVLVTIGSWFFVMGLIKLIKVSRGKG
ncbi:MAG: MFS transporter [Candidatus Omnitrophota bacterium]